MNDKTSPQPPSRGKQARLPFGLMGPVISTMDFGHTYYTVPWAMWADEEGMLWLHPGYDTTDRPHGTSSMRVELREDGYHVWPLRDYTYRPQSAAGYVGTPSQPYIPVAELEGPGR